MTDPLHSINQRSFLSPWLEDTSAAQMESLGVQGGFSGAIIWKVSLENKFYCLRRWPQGHPTIDGLSAMHGLMRHVDQVGFKLSPVPLPTQEGQTYYLNEEHLWEFTNWLPGEANFLSQPSPGKLKAAACCLADFHRAAKLYTNGNARPQVAVSSGLNQRLSILQKLQQSELDLLWHATRSAAPTPLRELALELLEGILNTLEKTIPRCRQLVDQPLPLQWCLRDVRHDHFLFTEDRVTGLIDFGAVAVDSVAGDLARMLGSMTGDDGEAWRSGIEAYTARLALSAAERRAIVVFDEGGTICSAANWVRWLFVDQRVFPQANALTNQLQWIASRLGALKNISGASLACGW